jgi:hypothetical protein
MGVVEFPPRSPDLTPMDFFLWGHIKDKVYSRNPRIIDDLKATIVRECEAIPRAMLCVVLDSLVLLIRGALLSRVINLNICTECHVNTYFNIHLSPKTISNINKHDSYLGLKCLYIFLRHPILIRYSSQLNLPSALRFCCISLQGVELGNLITAI